MISQYPHVRAGCLCMGCGGHKPHGLLLCWPCHQAEKDQNDGVYSPAMERRLNRLEALLSSGKVKL